MAAFDLLTFKVRPITGLDKDGQQAQQDSRFLMRIAKQSIISVLAFAILEIFEGLPTPLLVAWTTH